MAHAGRVGIPREHERSMSVSGSLITDLLFFTSHSHFLMHFDTNPRVLNTLSARLRSDPRVIKWTTLKLGERLEQITPRTIHGDQELEQHYHPVHLGGGLTVQASARR